MHYLGVADMLPEGCPDAIQQYGGCMTDSIEPLDAAYLESKRDICQNDCDLQLMRGMNVTIRNVQSQVNIHVIGHYDSFREGNYAICHGGASGEADKSPCERNILRFLRTNEQAATCYTDWTNRKDGKLNGACAKGGKLDGSGLTAECKTFICDQFVGEAVFNSCGAEEICCGVGQPE